MNGLFETVVGAVPLQVHPTNKQEDCSGGIWNLFIDAS
jgi:hypothetical protein